VAIAVKSGAGWSEELRISILLLVLGAMPLASRPPNISQSKTVYLFDCQGRIFQMEIPGLSHRTLRHVTEIDPTLPESVRDGCAIQSGWYDGAGNRLVLVVQTEAWQGESESLPTKLIELRDFTLASEDTESPSPARPREIDRQEIVGRLASLRAPFARSFAYVLDDGVTALLQELAPSGLSADPIALDIRWDAGAIGLRQPTREATGRYALFDLVAGAQRGAVVSTVKEIAEQRVVCVTASGFVFLAAARDALLVLDVADTTRRLDIANVPVDLYWTACASS
jgi:hypothetical protein